MPGEGPLRLNGEREERSRSQGTSPPATVWLSRGVQLCVNYLYGPVVVVFRHDDASVRYGFALGLIPDLSLRLTAARLCASAGVFFVPLNLLIAATSILAFIAGESSVSNDNTTFNIVVGCLAAFGVFWNSCDRMLGYKSRADMHTGAKMVC